MTFMRKRGRRIQIRRKSLAPDRVAVGSYIDSIVLIQHKKIDEARFAILQRTFGPGRGILGLDIMPDKALSPTGYWIHTLALHRPTLATVHLLDELLQHGQQLKEVHVALDVLVETPELALAWQDFFEGHLITNPKAPRSISVYDTVTYYNAHLAAGESFALYSDRPARLKEGLMCCHLEVRVMGPKALRVAKLWSPDALRQMNHRRFWNERLKLFRPPSLFQIARASNKAGSSCHATAAGDEANQRRAVDLLLASQNVREKVVAQSLLAKMREARGLYSKRPLRLFTPQQHYWLLPSRHNVQWNPCAWD